MSIKTNTTDLQALLEVANNLPTVENLDTELSTQDTLIADIMTALEGKTAGGGGSAEISICTAFITDPKCAYGTNNTVVFTDGMTWGDYVNSDWNRIGIDTTGAIGTEIYLQQSSTNIICRSNSSYYLTTNGAWANRVNTSDEIIDGHIYVWLYAD